MINKHNHNSYLVSVAIVEAISKPSNLLWLQECNRVCEEHAKLDSYNIAQFRYRGLIYNNYKDPRSMYINNLHPSLVEAFEHAYTFYVTDMTKLSNRSLVFTRDLMLHAQTLEDVLILTPTCLHKALENLTFFPMKSSTYTEEFVKGWFAKYNELFEEMAMRTLLGAFN